jgi:hypothetical protein
MPLWRLLVCAALKEITGKMLMANLWRLFVQQYISRQTKQKSISLQYFTLCGNKVKRTSSYFENTATVFQGHKNIFVMSLLKDCQLLSVILIR